MISRSTLATSSLADVARLICEAAADGLGRLGIEARYRPRNDIEVDGRKISRIGLGGHQEISIGKHLLEVRMTDKKGSGSDFARTMKIDRS